VSTERVPDRFYSVLAAAVRSYNVCILLAMVE
jgi:hypothetical protein